MRMLLKQIYVSHLKSVSGKNQVSVVWSSTEPTGLYPHKSGTDFKYTQIVIFHSAKQQTSKCKNIYLYVSLENSVKLWTE